MSRSPSSAYAARLLSSPLFQQPDGLKRLAQLAVPALADFCFIFLVNGKQVRCGACAHVSDRGGRLLRELNRIYRINADDPRSDVAQVIRSRRPVVRTDIHPETEPLGRSPRVLQIHRRLAVRSALAVPIVAGDTLLGVLALCMSESGRRYTAREVPRFERLAARVGRALSSALAAQATPSGTARRRRAHPVVPLRRSTSRLRARI
jgi:GAF domain-containing protein